jgi:nicotinamidase/pyrazinamidase
MKKSVRALLIVDVQNDFLPGGALAVGEGDQIIPVINRIQSHFPVIIASKDWHPAGHSSFAATHHRPIGEVINLDGIDQILWPVHCVQGTSGASFADELVLERIDHIVYKGIDPKIDSYSAIYDNARQRSTGLMEYLNERKVTDLYIAGLATDYCVKFTALDAISEGLKVHLIEDACRGVNLQPEDTAKAIEEMRAAGAEVIQSTELI